MKVISVRMSGLSECLKVLKNFNANRIKKTFGRRKGQEGDHQIGKGNRLSVCLTLPSTTAHSIGPLINLPSLCVYGVLQYARIYTSIEHVTKQIYI